MSKDFLKIDKKIISLFAGRGLQAVLAVVSIRMMTELLSPHEIGNQYLINSVLLWFSLVLVNPMGMFINRHINEWKISHELRYFLKKINGYFALIALISLPIVFIVKNYWNIGESIPQFDLMIFILIYIYFSTWFQTLVSFFNLFEFQKIFVSLNILSQFIGLIAAFVAVQFIRSDALGWMGGLLFGQIIALALGVYFFYTKVLVHGQPTQASPLGLFNRQTFLFCYPVAITTIFMWFLNQGYRLVIDKNLGTEALASIGIGIGLAASLAGVVEAITTQYLYPKYYASLPNSTLESRTAAWFVLWKKTTVIYIICAFFILSLLQIVVRLLASQSFQHVVSFIVFGVVIEFFKQNSNIIYLSAHGEKKTQKTILPYMMGVVVLVACFTGLIFKEIFTIENLLWSLVISNVATYLFNVVQVKNTLNVSFEFSAVMRALLLSIPFLVLYGVTFQNTHIGILLVSATLSLVWCLASLYYINRKLD